MKFSGRSIACVLGLLVSAVLHAQEQEHRWWYFGFGAGLDMGTSPPTMLSNGALSTDEGVTSIADASGQLQFYTNGATVWDRTHAAMPNGTGLMGHFSSSQSALIVPFPDDPQRYYLFTVPALGAMPGGWDAMAYSVVDMSANGGLGDVTLLNQPLVGPVVEKLTATRHANGRDTWVVAHTWQGSTYHAYLVSCWGILGPVDSDVGRPITNDAFNSPIPQIGCMQFNPRGDNLATTWGEFNGENNGTSRLDLLHFDNSTGILTLADSVTHSTPNWDIRGYGVCFSPSGDRLYQSENGLQDGGALARIMQYSVIGDQLVNEVEISQPSGLAYGTLQRAPDGTIYAARLNGAQFLSRITAPDAAGAACGFVDYGVGLNAPSTWGLPNHWDTHPPIVPPEIVLNDTTICDGGTMTLDATVTHALIVPQYEWSTGELTPSITVRAPGTYSVNVILGCDTLVASAQIDFGGIPFDLGADTLLCLADSLLLRIPTGAAAWLWSDGSADSTLQVSAGTWSLTVSDGAGCITADERIVTTADCSCAVYIPNAVTPNADGINDVFGAVQQCALRSYAFTLYDRWGREVWHSEDPDERWGDPGGAAASPIALYAWQLHLRYWDGQGERSRSLSGHLNVVR
ncbi:MAG: gliding motility-associated C-terminal domain-containing protein [Flavobacteriales bacterium]|nr:gliding motility-associated C-terminal domain-containing protein [Flavobacteriales bacterium]